MKLLIKIAILLLITISIYPQGPTPNDAEIKLRNYKDKSLDNKEYATLLKEYSNSIKYSYPDKSIDSLKKALDIFLKLEDKDGVFNIAESYNQLGDIYYSLELYYLAMENYSSSYKYFTKGKNGSLEYVLVNIGNCFYAQKIYDIASEYYEKALAGFIKAKDNHGIALIYNNYGLIELKQNRPVSGLKYFNKALDIRRAMGEDYLIGHSYGYLTQSYYQMKDYKNAIIAANTGINILSKSRKEKEFVQITLGEIYSRLTDIYIDLNDYQNALLSIQKADEIFKKIKNDLYSIKLSFKAGQIYFIMKDYEKAAFFVNQGVLKALSRNSFSELREGYQLLTKISLEQGNRFQALENLENLNKAVDTLLNSTLVKKLTEITTVVETNKIENEKTILQEKNKANQYLLTFFGILFTIMLLFFLYRLQNERKNEIRFQQIADATFECIVIHQKGKITNVNSNFEKMFGVSGKEVIGQNITKYLNFPEEISEFESKSFESKTTTIEGKEIDIEVLSKPYQYKSRDFSVVAFKDISERKKIDEQLKMSEELYRKIVMTVPYILTIHDISGNIQFVNQIGLKQLGYDFEEDKISEKHLLDFIAEEDKQKAIDNFTKMFEQHLGPVEYYLIHKSGKKELFEVQGELLCTPENVPYGVIFILRSIEDRKRAEQKLRTSENRFRQLAEAGYEALFIHKNGIVYDLNTAACRLFGYERAEVIGTHLADLFAPDSKEMIVERLRTYETASYEANCLSKNDKVIPCELNSRYIHFDDELVRLTAIRDISDRKKSEKELSDIKNLLEASYEQTPVPLTLIGYPDSSIRILNSAAIEFYGLNPETNFIGKKWREVNNLWQSFDTQGNLINPNDLPSSKAEHGIKSLKREIRIVRQDGIEKWGLEFSVPIYNKHGEQIATYSSALDITERKKIEEALKLNEEKYRFMAENMVDVIWQLDKNFNYVYISPYDEAMRGFKTNEVLGKSLWEHVTPKTKEYILALNELKEANERKGIRMEAKPYMVEQYCKDGSTIWCEVTVNPIFDSIGNANGFIGVTRNITERKKIQEELLEAKNKAELANKTKSEFLANMSHEIRTPMNAILGFTELIKSKYDDPVISEYLTGIETGGRNLLHLINDILDLSKIEAGKIVIKNEPLHVASLCSEIEQIFSYQIKAKDIKFAVMIEEGFPDLVIIDEIRLRQILLNLVGNAIKFTSTGEVNVKISFDRIEAVKKINLAISVEDTGIGIESSQLEKIFEAFYQQEGQNTRRYGGTGLGLTITRRLVEIMGGKIDVVSEINKGSVFTVSLTGIDVQEEADDLTVQSEHQVTFRNSVVLIARDQNSGRNLIKDYLHNSDIKFVDAEIGEGSVDLIRLRKPDLIIIDFDIIENGIKLLHEIKKLNIAYNLPIISILEQGDENNIEIINNCSSFLLKPIRKKVLVSELMKYLPNTVNQITVLENDSENSNRVDKKVIDLLFEKYLKKSEEIAGEMILDEISIFANELKEFAIDNNIPVIIKYTIELENAIGTYNFQKITNTLREFKTRLHELQKINL